MARQIEKRLLNEWLWEFRRDLPQWKRVRLGQVPTRELAAMYKVGLRWADAIVWNQPVLEIIEAKIRPHLSGIAELEVYKELLPITPEFEKYRLQPIKCIFLTTIEDKNIEPIIKKKGFEYVVFTPAWVKEYWQERWGIRI